MTMKNFQPPTHEEIARYAYHLWESEGRIHGRDLDYWLQAQAHLAATREYEASLLNSNAAKEFAASEEIAPRTETITASIAVPTSKPSRKRQSRASRAAAEVLCA